MGSMAQLKICIFATKLQQRLLEKDGTVGDKLKVCFQNLDKT